MAERIEEGRNATDISALFSNLISNPEALSKMKEIISKIGAEENGNDSPPNENNLSNNENTTEESEQESFDKSDNSPTLQNFDISGIMSKMPEILSKISSAKEENSLATKQQISLLLAIRPYLSEHRRELIDTFIKMNKLGAIFKNLT